MENKGMRKEAYYFSHDSNARNDEKILSMRMELGLEGYGIYWCIIEKMRENADYMCLNNYKIIAYDLRVEETIVKKVVENYGLFLTSECGNKFYSLSLMNRMEKMNEKSEKARQSANARWKKPDKKTSENANAMRTHTEGNAIKESKGKEIKGNELNEKNINENSLIEDFTEKEFIDDWAKCRMTYKNAETDLKRLQPGELENFNRFKRDYGRQEFRNALNALFRQKNIKFSTMINKPTHFLERVDTYVNAFLAKDDKLYGTMERSPTDITL